MRTIGQAEMQYDSAYHTYACPISLLGGDPKSGAPSAQAAQLLDPTLASSSQKSGYTFAITCGSKVTINNQDVYDSYDLYRCAPGQSDRDQATAASAPTKTTSSRSIQPAAVNLHSAHPVAAEFFGLHCSPCWMNAPICRLPLSRQPHPPPSRSRFPILFIPLCITPAPPRLVLDRPHRCRHPADPRAALLRVLSASLHCPPGPGSTANLKPPRSSVMHTIGQASDATTTRLLPQPTATRLHCWPLSAATPRPGTHPQRSPLQLIDPIARRHRPERRLHLRHHLRNQDHAQRPGHLHHPIASPPSLSHPAKPATGATAPTRTTSSGSTPPAALPTAPTSLP